MNQQHFDLGRPANLGARAREIANVPKSPHKCGDCKHLQGNPNPAYMVCLRVRPGKRTQRRTGSEGCGAFEPKG